VLRALCHGAQTIEGKRQRIMNPNNTRVQSKTVYAAGAFTGRNVKTAALPVLPQAVASEPENSEPQPLEISKKDEACVIASSSCGDSEGPADEKACPSHFRCGDCSEMLHELSNVMTGVLTNAQLLGWKLPPYSHLKRSVREVERGAQRSGELLRRLKERCAAQP
jgi:hypothetical protein